MRELFGAAGALGYLLLVLSIPFTLIMLASLPWCLWSVTRNVAKTRRALERIADAVDSGPRPGGGGVLGI